METVWERWRGRFDINNLQAGPVCAEGRLVMNPEE